MRKSGFAWLIAGVVSSGYGEASAQTTEKGARSPIERAIDVPRCDRGARELSEFRQPPDSRAVLTLIDETTVVPVTPKDLRASAIDAASGPLALPGTHATIMRFSTMSADRFMSTVLKGRLDIPISVKDDPNQTISKRQELKARELDLKRCIEQQRSFFKRGVQESMSAVFNNSTPEIQQSEILSAIKEAARLLKERTASEKVLFVISDLLEHSSALSFYKGGAMRPLDPPTEMRAVEGLGLLPDLKGVKVYVMGAWLIPEKSAGVQAARDPRTRSTHESFWKIFFERAGASLIEIGKPEILGEVK